MPPDMLQRKGFFPLATLLRERRFGLVLIGALCLHVVLSSLNLPAWECPFFRLTGVPCPGCGLTRACSALLRGDVQTAIKFHAFAPVFILLIGMLLAATVLPRKLTEPLIHKTEILERRTGLTIIILSGLILYWLARLIFYPTVFAQLIRG